MADVVPLSQHIGAEIRGVRLGPDLDEATVAAIRATLLQWKVVLFRDQDLDRDAHVALGTHFGHVSPGHPTLPPRFPGHPEIVPLELDHHPADPEASILEHRWHSDVTYVEAPPMGSILRAVELPPYGGDTEWSNLAAAYAALSPPLRTMIDGLHAVHHNVLHLVRGEPTPLMRSFMATPLRAVHPVVTVHPETGERVLYVNPDYTSHILGLSRRESGHLLACLYEHLTDREFTVRFTWSPGTVAFRPPRAGRHPARCPAPDGAHHHRGRAHGRGRRLPVPRPGARRLTPRPRRTPGTLHTR